LPYNNLSDEAFCEKLGITKNGILTYGGLLMLDYSEAAFFLDDKVSDSVEKIVEVITPPITELERKLLGIIRQNPTGSRKEFAKELGISTGVVKEYTDKLKQKGVLERKGNNRTGYWEIKKTDN
jgi:predicted HTH transcriptional regulator